MLGSPILDVAIGMTFLYLLLSLIASALQEILASFVQARSANLERGIRSLFSNGRVTEDVTFVQAIYHHGLVQSLYQTPSQDYDESTVRFFFRNLFGQVRLTARWMVGMHVPGKKAHINDLLLPAYIPSRVFAVALRDILSKGAVEGQDAMVTIKTNLQTISTTLPQTDGEKNLAAEALLALVRDCGGKSDLLQGRIEAWYNDAMDRVSGWYKRYTQNVLIVIGLALAAALNVDSIRVARTLWVDKDARAGLSSAADGYLKTHPNGPDEAATATSKSADFTQLEKNLQGTANAFNDVSTRSLLPVGWRHSYREYAKALSGSKKEQALKRLLLALVGWIVTAAALSFGAPFWFDTLNRFMIVRSTVKPQEKSQTEPSKN